MSMRKLPLSAMFLLVFTSAASAWQMDLIWERRGFTVNTRFGKSVGGVGDINGDGYGDFAVGAFDEKKLYIFYGGNPPDTIPDIVIDSCAVWGIRGMVDLNGDGIFDLVTWSGNKVTIYWGHPGFNPRPDLILRFPGDYVAFHPTELSIGGDFNGDELTDVVLFLIAEETRLPDYKPHDGDALFVVFHKTKEGYLPQVLLDGKPRLIWFDKVLATLPSQEILTAKGKGYASDPSELDTIHPQFDSIHFQNMESTASIFFYNKDGEYKRVWLSD